MSKTASAPILFYLTIAKNIKKMFDIDTEPFLLFFFAGPLEHLPLHYSFIIIPLCLIPVGWSKGFQIIQVRNKSLAPFLCKAGVDYFPLAN